MLNKVILMGRMTRDPELRHTQSNIPVVPFTLAVDRGLKKDGQNTDFINIIAWRATAEFVSKWLTKGQLIAVSGSLQSRTYKDRDGNNRAALEVVADEVYFSESKREKTDSANHAEADYSAGFEQNAGEFEEVIGEDEELPFWR